MPPKPSKSFTVAPQNEDNASTYSYDKQVLLLPILTQCTVRSETVIPAKNKPIAIYKPNKPPHLKRMKPHKTRFRLGKIQASPSMGEILTKQILNDRTLFSSDDEEIPTDTGFARSKSYHSKMLHHSSGPSSVSSSRINYLQLHCREMDAPAVKEYAVPSTVKLVQQSDSTTRHVHTPSTAERTLRGGPKRTSLSSFRSSSDAESCDDTGKVDYNAHSSALSKSLIETSASAATVVVQDSYSNELYDFKPTAQRPLLCTDHYLQDHVKASPTFHSTNNIEISFLKPESDSISNLSREELQDLMNISSILDATTLYSNTFNTLSSKDNSYKERHEGEKQLAASIKDSQNLLIPATLTESSSPTKSNFIKNVSNVRETSLSGNKVWCVGATDCNFKYDSIYRQTSAYDSKAEESNALAQIKFCGTTESNSSLIREEAHATGLSMIPTHKCQQLDPSSESWHYCNAISLAAAMEVPCSLSKRCTSRNFNTEAVDGGDGRRFSPAEIFDIDVSPSKMPKNLTGYSVVQKTRGNVLVASFETNRSANSDSKDLRIRHGPCRYSQAVLETSILENSTNSELLDFDHYIKLKNSEGEEGTTILWKSDGCETALPSPCGKFRPPSLDLDKLCGEIEADGKQQSPSVDFSPNRSSHFEISHEELTDILKLYTF